VNAIKAAYPKAARTDWITGEKNARNLVLSSVATWMELLAGVERYAKLCNETGRMVLNPANFFGAIDRPWSQPWDVPAGKPDKGAPPRRNDEATLAEASARAKAIGFRDRWPQESPAAYMTQVKLEESRARSIGSRITNLTERKRVN